MKKLVSLILALAMIFSLCAINASADSAPIKITTSSGTYYYEPSSGKWRLTGGDDTDVTAAVNALGITSTYTADKTTMVVENATVETIVIDNSADITFKGTNNLSATFDTTEKASNTSYGLCVNDDANITFAEGSKTVIGATKDGNYNNEDNYSIGGFISPLAPNAGSAINVSGDLKITGASNADVTAIARYNGIHCDKSIDFTGFSGKMTIRDYGLVRNCSINAGTDVTINGGEFDLESQIGNCIISTGNISISNAKINAKTSYTFSEASDPKAACIVTPEGKVTLTNSDITLNAQLAMLANTIDINDSACDVTGAIYLYGETKHATLNMNQGTLVVTGAHCIYGVFAITGENADVNFNGGLTKLAVEGECAATIYLLKMFKSSTCSINYSKVSLYEEKDGQKVYDFEGITALVCDGFNIIAVDSFENGAKVSTFAMPEYTEGADQTVQAGNAAKFRINIDNKFFTAAYVDGAKLNDADFTHEHGSTILTLKDSFVKTLAPGKHTLKVVYTILGTDMEAATTFTIVGSTPEDESIADTADPTQVALTAILMLVSASGTALVAKKRNED